MGVDREAASSLLLARAWGASFERTLMLGRQRMHMQPRDLEAAFEDVGVNLARADAKRLFDGRDGFAEPLLTLLGAGTPLSLDASGVEDATLVHDLNQPVPGDWRERHSLVWDGGTLEHVFNLPVALKSVLDMVEVGGHYLGMSPANNWMGHGFFQFSPELWFRVLSPANGYEVVWMLIRAARHPTAGWYKVRDPAEVGERVTLTAHSRATTYVLARRTERREILAELPQQSDYSASWEAGEDDRARGAGNLKHKLRSALNRTTSSRVTDALFTASVWTLPRHDGRFFERVQPRELARMGPAWSELEHSLTAA